MFKVGDRVERREENKNEYFWETWKPQGEIFTVTKVIPPDFEADHENIILGTNSRKFVAYKFRLVTPKRSVVHHFSDTEIVHDK